MSRRLLIITLQFPPAHHSATRRIAKFARYLPEHGWESSVVTVRTRYHRQLDENGLLDVPAGTRVYRAFGFDPRNSLSVGGHYPGLLALPDRAASWLPFATRRALAVARRERIDAILSTSPPVTAHCVALLVQRRTGLPWAADFRDPWSVEDRGPLKAALDRRLEARVVRAADRILVTTRALAGDLHRRFGLEVADKTRELANGYDEHDFASLPTPAMNGRFSIAHVGQVYRDHRNPALVLEAVRRCLDQGLLPGDAEVVFVGAGPMADGGGELQRIVAQLGLQHAVRTVPHIDYRSALQTIVSSPALLLLQCGDALHAEVPAKAFEYLRSGRRILTVAPAHSATADLMQRFAGVEVASPSDVADIADKLVVTYRAWQRGGHGIERDLSGCDRRSLTARLAAILNELYGGTPPPASDS